MHNEIKYISNQNSNTNLTKKELKMQFSIPFTSNFIMYNGIPLPIAIIFYNLLLYMYNALEMLLPIALPL
ncbi:hypothetical protein XENTR_v10005726 [Xenopus tropicalis]|nr:hypothetical protein XENTR_v10005726 [Xenopus tropicalis]